MINVYPRLLGNLQYIPKPTLLPGCLVASTSMILTFRLKKEKQRPELSLARELKKKIGMCEMFPIFTNLYAYKVCTVRLFGRLE